MFLPCFPLVGLRQQMKIVTVRNVCRVYPPNGKYNKKGFFVLLIVLINSTRARIDVKQKLYQQISNENIHYVFTERLFDILILKFDEIKKIIIINPYFFLDSLKYENIVWEIDIPH